MYIFDLEKKTHNVAGEGHTQIITDVRFKPNSDVLATSSFDKTVRIWDAGNVRNLIYSLLVCWHLKYILPRLAI